VRICKTLNVSKTLYDLRVFGIKTRCMAVRNA
jgi:hypothetical protein